MPRFRVFRRSPAAPEPPIRAELFGIERLEQHAESLAAAQPVHGARGRGRSILARVSDNARVLRAAYHSLTAQAQDGQPVAPAAEWVIENFHVVDEQLREIRDDLPPGYYRELPKLTSGPFAGSPRVYGIAWAFVAHTDSRFDPEWLRRFILAYQHVQPLTIGELWAVAITLRIVLVENLRRLAIQILQADSARMRADALADRWLNAEGATGEGWTGVVRDLSPLPSAFAVRLIQRFRDHDPDHSPGLTWLRRHLFAQDVTPDAVVQADMQAQAATTVTMRNVITSMRLMSALDWAGFFESVSLVDEVLRTGSDFAAMDFASRDSYRHAIEELSRGSGFDELMVTHAVMARRVKSELAADPGRIADRREDPGFYLIGDGRREFERSIGFRPGMATRIARWYLQVATPGYLGTIALLTLALLALPVWAGTVAGATWPVLLALALVGWAPASDLAVALTNRWVTAIVRPRLLPRLALRDGIPGSLRSIVVIPTLLTDIGTIEEQLERLEVHYLANADDEVQFALVTDWTDADQAETPGDDLLLAGARRGIGRLNERHGTVAGGQPRFLLLHRARRWNAAERCWIGWERKRGKLRELNRLLRGATDTSFLLAPGELTGLMSDIRYVISLDADTRLPIGIVRELVGTLAHPLNHARFDPALGRVREGYGVLQPRITPPLPMGEGSLFQQMASGSAGIDPYAAAISDVYQDLYRNGSYTGKGIYAIDAFEAALDARVPENALLSHDLFEGIFARTGLVTDVEFFEATPSHYLAAAARQHRWARGDWQLLPFIFRFPIATIDRWKMLDNLRRTVSAPGAWLTLVLSWLLPAAAPVAWTAFVVATIALPAMLPVLAGLPPRGRGISKRAHIRAVMRDFRVAALHTALTVVMLAYQAWLMTDAIVRTLGRLFLTHRHLLEWVTAAQAEAGLRLRLRVFVRHMAGAVLLALITAVLISRIDPSVWPLAAAFIVLWAASPAIAHGISIPHAVEPSRPLSTDDTEALRLIARRTWRFFTRFVGPEDRHLPPDNFQETPAPVVAHRTSPTNIGLYLLVTVAANDFGWIGTLDLVDRLEATLASMDALERLHGHFYNWYDTVDGRPLEPRYVSSVDSGNLAGALIALAGACEDLLSRPVFDRAVFAGLNDTAILVRDSADAAERGRFTTPRRALHAAVREITAAAHPHVANPMQWASRLQAIGTLVADIASLTATIAAEESQGDHAPMLQWVAELQQQVVSHRRDIDTLGAWALRGGAVAGAGDVASMLAPLAAMPGLTRRATERLAAVRAQLVADGNTPAAMVTELDAGVAAFTASRAACAELVRRLHAVSRRALAMVSEMDFRFLFDPVRQLFAIGYRVAEGAMDPSQYDLLASEARLTSFVAIAKGDVPVSHWFHLGRALTPVGRDSVLISWSGSMFEYLMPALVMQVPEGGLLDQTCRLVVRRQIGYGAERGVPWGVSESAYSVRNIEMTYQYSTFGVPGLGLRRQLGEDLVIAPYATGLAAMFDAPGAAANFRQLAAAGGSGPYGFYEALDFTPSRVPTGARVAVVQTYMAHHQGMLLLGLADALQGGLMRQRFHAQPMVRASELLLQERTPRDVPVARPPEEEIPSAPESTALPPAARRFNSPHGAAPRTHLLSNGRYSVMVTSAGSGYSRWHDLAVTRWRDDTTRDATGSFIYCRDVHSDAIWSTGFQPTGVEPDDYAVTLSEDRAEFVRRDGSLITRCELIVSPEDDAEVRRVSLTNRGLRTREIEVTSYAEVVLAPHAADVAHPAFSNLFVHTEALPEGSTLLATRRPRAAEDPQIWLAHVVAVDGEAGPLEWESDRARFVGRGRDLRWPIAMTGGRPLSSSAGSVLDPVVALRRRIRLRPGAQARLVFSTMVAASRDAALDLADKYHDTAIFERAAALAWTQAQVQLHHLGVAPDEAQLFQSVAGSLLYPDRAMRAPGDVLARPNSGQSALWAQGISGDLPIVLVQVDELDDIGLVRQLLRAHEYWRMKRLPVDLVIVNERGPSYVQDLQITLETMVRAVQPVGPDPHHVRGSVFAVRADQLQPADRDALLTAARVVLSGRRGSLAEQLLRVPRVQPAAPPRVPPKAATPVAAVETVPPELEFFNGLGGFGANGREYVTVLAGDTSTPAPWINVIANADFGFHVSESGAGYTWSVNSQENQLTRWSNDPVCDPAGEAFYIRDEESEQLWSPVAQPIRDGGSYVARHGAGYSRFLHRTRGISSDLLQFVPTADPIKIVRLTLVNHTSRVRHLSVTAYVEWVLGASREAGAPYIVSEVDPATNVLLARNGWNADFRDRIAFADLAGRQTDWTADRAEFIGRNGSLEHPAAFERRLPLSRRAGAGLDPCAVLQAPVELAPGGEVTVDFLLGEAATRADALALVQRYRAADLDQVFADVTRHWDTILDTVQVTTPDRSLDLMLNRWLLYQTLACRIWARAAFYQASGAYGFRDQLQDVMALVPAAPALVRAHLLRSAARQFTEGDVQHWWHPTNGRGVRTRISDDLLWLPYVVQHYVAATGDRAVLDVEVPFLEGPRLAPDELECYFTPRRALDGGTLFEHCARAIDRSLTVGAHGLPLIGTGDWNDGMNRVGYHGRGESVWLGWFLCDVIAAWSPIAGTRGEHRRADAWREHAGNLQAALNRDGWDGDWYRRAYFDDGTPLGSATNDECRIDAIAQSWSVISGAGDAARAQRAMVSLEQQLVRRADLLHLLLTPAFDHTPLEPGYIKGYLPGVRENGGQYTHAAIWSLVAWTMLRDGGRAGELFHLLNPVHHSSTAEAIARYKVEPYVIAGDVYSEPPHVGRGGWTWYSGSAGWLYRGGLEYLLGVRLRDGRLVVDPCIPAEWPGFEMHLRRDGLSYDIRVDNPDRVSHGVRRVQVDGVDMPVADGVVLVQDGTVHQVVITLGGAA